MPKVLTGDWPAHADNATTQPRMANAILFNILWPPMGALIAGSYCLNTGIRKVLVGFIRHRERHEADKNTNTVSRRSDSSRCGGQTAAEGQFRFTGQMDGQLRNSPTFQFSFYQPQGNQAAGMEARHCRTAEAASTRLPGARRKLLYLPSSRRSMLGVWPYCSLSR